MPALKRSSNMQPRKSSEKISHVSIRQRTLRPKNRNAICARQRARATFATRDCAFAKTDQSFLQKLCWRRCATAQARFVASQKSRGISLIKFAAVKSKGQKLRRKKQTKQRMTFSRP